LFGRAKWESDIDVPTYFTDKQVKGEPFIPTDVLQDFESACWGAIHQGWSDVFKTKTVKETKNAIEKQVKKYSGTEKQRASIAGLLYETTGKIAGTTLPLGPVCTNPFPEKAQKKDPYKGYQYVSKRCKSADDKEECKKIGMRILDHVDDKSLKQSDKNAFKGLEKTQHTCQWTADKCVAGTTSKYFTPHNARGWVLE